MFNSYSQASRRLLSAMPCSAFFELFTPHSDAMDVKIAKIYYGHEGYWKGIAATKKLSEAAKELKETARTVAEQASALADIPPRRGEFFGRNLMYLHPKQ